MQQGTRKFFANQRSVPKQSKPTYQQVIHTQKQINHPYYAQYSAKKQLQKISSDADLRTPKEQYFKNLNQRRKNQGQMSNLKSQLQNLKNEVNKLISKETAIRTPQKQKLAIKQEFSGGKKVNYVSKGFKQDFTDKQQDFSDTASMTSVTTQKVLNQPLRRLERKVSNQNYDQTYYMQLENDLLKTEIKNLKNKYVSKKRQLSQKCQLLEKKNQYLQVSLHNSEQALAQCRKTLELDIMAIKRQITLKTQIKNQVHLPETDKPQIIPGQANEMLQQKLKKLYEEMSEKNKLINNLSIQLGDVEAILERKKFDLKKQTQKSLQLSRQIELTKRESSRLQSLIETQISKKKDLIKQNETLKQKNRQLMQEIYKKEQIVSGSQQYENRMVEQIELYKKKQDELQQRLSGLREENRKLKQLVSTNNDEILMLKKSHDDTITRIGQLSRKLKEQQQKSQDRQNYYRKILQESKAKEQQSIKILKQHYETQFAFREASQSQITKSQSQSINELLKQKERQINKWKAEYKILKLKHEQKQTSEALRNQEVEKYYKGYVQGKNQISILTEKNKMLETNSESYRKRLSDKLNEGAKQQLLHERTVKSLNAEITKLNHQIENLNDEFTLAKTQLNQLNTKYQEQLKHRQQIESKIESFVLKKLSPQSSDDQQDKQEDNASHQSDLGQNSETKNSKRFLQDSFEKQNISSQKKIVRKDKKSRTEKSQFEPLSQSDKLQLQQISESITTIKKRVIQQDQKLAKNVRQLKNKDTQITKLKKQIRQLLETHEKELNDIKEKYTEQKTQKLIKQTLQAEKSFKQKCEKQIQIYKNKYNQILDQNVHMKRKISEYQKESLDLRQQTKSLSHLYNVKCAEVQEIVQRSLNQIATKDKKIDQINLIKQQRQGNLLNEISHLKDQISSLRIDIKNLASINQKIQASSFDEALKNQIQTSKVLREQLLKKNQELFKVRDNYTLLRSQYDNLRSQSEIQKLKNLSERKNLEVQYQIEMQNLKNRLSVEEKKISSLQQKIALVIEQNKKKDSFIQSYIMGKKLPQGEKEFVAQFIKQYEISLNGKSINQKLRADSHELDKMAEYNYRLLKDLAEMKQKMLLYETMEGQVLSVYDSKQSCELNRQNDIDSPNTSLNQSPYRAVKKFKKMSSLVDVEKD